MKSTATLIKLLITLGVLALASLSTTAQIALPYYTGFDDEAQKKWLDAI